MTSSTASDVLVVMPFGEDWSDQVLDALLKLNIKDTRGRIHVKRADQVVPKVGNLQEHIELLNRGSGLVIADITGANPNVLIEVGIALALQTPLLLITQDRDGIPTHLKGLIIDEYSLTEESLERTTTHLLLRIEEVLSIVKAKRIEASQQQIYSVECFATRNFAALQNYFRESKYRIDILTTNLSFLFEEYGNESSTYFDEIQHAMDRPNSKTKIRLLTLDPESDFAAKRGKQLGYAPQVFRDMLRESLTKVRSFEQKYPRERYEVRVYDDFPNQIMYRVDNDIFHCVVAQPTASRRHLTFKFERHLAGVDSSFTDHFQSIWSKVA